MLSKCLHKRVYSEDQHYNNVGFAKGWYKHGEGLVSSKFFKKKSYFRLVEILSLLYGPQEIQPKFVLIFISEKLNKTVPKITIEKHNFCAAH